MLMNIDIDEGVDPRKQLLLERRAMVLTMIIDCFKIAGLVCAAAAYAVLQNDENRQQATNPTLVDMATTLLAGYLASMTLSILPSAVLYVNAARKQTAEYADFAEFGFFLTPPSGFRFSTIEAPIELAALPNAAPASAQLYRPASQIALAA